MEIIIQPDSESASHVAARIIAALIRRKPNAVLGLPTGETPLLLYKELIRMHQDEDLDFAQVSTFNLDEYAGLTKEHPSSYHIFMYDNFFQHVNLSREKIHIPSGTADDIPAHCAEYEKAIRKLGGIDLQVLGIGSDGHIGFNEPSSSLTSRTRIKTLTKKTRQDNSRFFDSLEKVPHHVITMGIGSILESNMCILLAFGKRKAKAIAWTVEGPVTAMIPASALQLHANTKVIIDRAAASKLERRKYYQHVYKFKPSWQRDS